MPTPFAPRIILAQNLQTNLQALAHAHSTPQSLALRARIVLRAAGGYPQERTNRSRPPLLQPHRWQVAAAVPRARLCGPTRCPPLGATAPRFLAHPGDDHRRGQPVAARRGTHGHTVDVS